MKGVADSYLAKRLRDMRGGKIVNLTPQEIDAMLTEAADALDGQNTLLDLLTRMQSAGQPIDMASGDDDARIPAALWREFVDAHARLLYTRGSATHGGISNE